MDATALLHDIEASIIAQHRGSTEDLRKISELTSQLRLSKDSEDRGERALQVMTEELEDKVRQLSSKERQGEEMSRISHGLEDEVRCTRAELEKEKAGRISDRAEDNERWAVWEKERAEEREQRLAKEQDWERELQNQAERQLLITEERDQASAREQDLLKQLEQTDEHLKAKLERVRREAEQGKAREQELLARVEEEERAREREKEALLEHLEKESRRAAEMGATTQKLKMEREDMEAVWAQEREALKMAGVERDAAMAREKEGLQGQLLQCQKTIKESEEIIRQLEMHNLDLHQAWKDNIESFVEKGEEKSKFEAAADETELAWARRAEAAQGEAQRLRSELSEILSSLGTQAWRATSAPLPPAPLLHECCI